MELKFLTVELIEQQLRLSAESYAEQMDVIELYAQSAEEEALQFMERDISEFIDEEGKVNMPKPIILACLHRIGESYKHREETSGIQLYPVPQNCWQDVLKPYIKPDAM